MKVPKNSGKHRRRTNKRSRHHGAHEPDQLTELLKLCLQKICQLQADLEHETSVQDAEAEGYSACALETLRFLSANGLPPDHPMVKTITETLLRDRD